MRQFRMLGLSPCHPLLRSRRMPGCRNAVERKALSASSRLVECLLPADAVGDDVEQALRGGHVVAVAGGDGSEA